MGRELGLSFVIFFAATLAFAQDRGSISGTITDTTGAGAPGVKVTLLNPSTGLSQAVVSGSDGAYTFVSLRAGEYNLSAEKPGFRKSDVNSVRVDVNTNSRVDIKLRSGLCRRSLR